MAIETNPSTSLFQSNWKRNRGGPVKFCKACNTRGHDEEHCFILHPEKAPHRWEMLPPKFPTPTISPHALQLMIAMEFANLDSLHALRTRRFDDFPYPDVLSPLHFVSPRSYGNTPGLWPLDSAPGFCVTDPTISL